MFLPCFIFCNLHDIRFTKFCISLLSLIVKGKETEHKQIQYKWKENGKRFPLLPKVGYFKLLIAQTFFLIKLINNFCSIFIMDNNEDNQQHIGNQREPINAKVENTSLN